MSATAPLIMDTHCHLDYIGAGIFGHDPDLDLADVVARAQARGVGLILNPAVNIADFDRVLATAERFEHVYAAIGVHPCEVEETKTVDDWQHEIRSRLNHPKVKALGETGLDYYHQAADSDHATLQRDCFDIQLAMAVDHDLPIIIHNREAHDDTEAIMKNHPTAQGIMHCFGGGPAEAERFMNRGFFISFAGNVTFKKAKELHEAAKIVPLERMLIETDSPFLSPVPERGRPNEPYRTRFVAELIAELKGIPVEELIEQTTQNALELFKIKIDTSSR